MQKCAYCGNTIVFGGVKEGHLRFCGQACSKQGGMARFADSLPDELVHEELLSLHSGSCPQCGRDGPNDVRHSYRVWSVIVLTFSNTRSSIACRSCGRKQAVQDALFCFFCGWWGFPFGIIFTPIQIARNIVSLAIGPNAQLPSTELETIVRGELARAIAQQQASAGPDAGQPAGAQPN